MNADDFDDFVARVRALLATSSPSAPRSPAERLFGIAAEAYRTWATRADLREKTVPLHEHAAMRQRHREAVERADAAERELATLRAGTTPSLRPALRRARNHPR